MGVDGHLLRVPRPRNAILVMGENWICNQAMAGIIITATFFAAAVMAFISYKSGYVAAYPVFKAVADWSSLWGIVLSVVSVSL